MSGQVTSKTFQISSENGFHLRPISMLVELAGRFESRITVSKDGMSVGAGSVMELLLLGAQQGDMLEVTATGQDSPEALNAIEEFFKELAEGDD
jgi:phosphocarrier protein